MKSDSNAMTFERRTMPISALFGYSLEQLLTGSPSNDHLVYQDDVPTLERGVIRTVRHEISEAQAKAIMRAIVCDETIGAAIREGLISAQLHPLGNLPIGGSHPVSHSRELIKNCISIQTLSSPPPVEVIGFFSTKAHEYFGANPSRDGGRNG